MNDESARSSLCRARQRRAASRGSARRSRALLLARSSFRVHRSSLFLPFVVVRLSVESARVRFRVHLENVVAIRRGRVGIVSVRERVPLVLSGHRIDEIAVAQQPDHFCVVELDRLRELVERFWIIALAKIRRFLDRAGSLRVAQFFVLIDRIRNFAEPLMQLDFFLPPDAKRGDRHSHRGEDTDDRCDRDEFCDCETARAHCHPERSEGPGWCGRCTKRTRSRPPAPPGPSLTLGVTAALSMTCSAHSTFARPPETSEATNSPRSFFRLGLSTTRLLSPVIPPRTRSVAISPPLLKLSGFPSEEAIVTTPCSRLIVTTGGIFGSTLSAAPNATSLTSSECGS